MKKAIFVDRDGVLIKDIAHLTKIKEVEFIQSSIKAIKILNSLGYLVIGISNQSVVARGLSTEEQVEKVNQYIIKYYKSNDAIIESIYYCPHYLDGIIKEYSKKCNCRKPEPGLILKAAKDFGINLKESFMVGDQESDIIAGSRAGCKTILLKSGYWDIKNIGIKPDHISPNLINFVDYVKGHLSI